MAIGDVFKVVVRGRNTASSVSFVNTFHYLQVLGGATFDLPSFLTSFIGSVVGDMQALLANAWVGVDVIATCVKGVQLGQQAIDTSIAGVAATGGATSEDYAYCIVVFRKGAAIGRHQRGRVFLSPVADSVFNADGSIAAIPGTLAAMESDMLVDQTDVNGFVAQQCLLSKVGSNATPVVQAGHSHRAGVRRHRRVP